MSLFSRLWWPREPFSEPETVEEAIDPPAPLRIEGRIDTYSDTWTFVRGWAEAELSKARQDNDSLTNDDVRTSSLRGRIKLLKELIELPLPPKRERKRPPRAFVSDDDTGY